MVNSITGYGIDHYTSAFVDGGEGGYKMQDDKDDGVKFLIDSGLVDKDRVAMFGWSYGGYAALVAASREDQLYQCVVACYNTLIELIFSRGCN